MAALPSYTLPLPEGIPADHHLHTEATTTIFVPKAGAFLNPVQHYNRDMSVAVIRAWNQLRKEELEAKWRLKLERRGGVPKSKTKRKRGKGQVEQTAVETTEESTEVPAVAAEEPQESVEIKTAEAGPSQERPFRAPSITILEALSATGLRSIRYAKEIPDVRYVIANDLSPSACTAMKRNVAFNGVGDEPEFVPTKDSSETEKANQIDTNINSATVSDVPKEISSTMEVDSEEAVGNGLAKTDKIEADAVQEIEEKDAVGRRPGCKGRVKVNEGDACTLMYMHRSPVGPTSRVDVVDLDPYGTAAPFIDAAIGCIADGGLLAITCTDLAVLAGQQYPEKCYSNYGGTNVHAEYTHEAALRLVFHSLATTAARYGRYITPLLSFSIDFYVRLFVRVHSGPEQVKRLASQTGVVFTCQYCQTSVQQPFGRIVEKETAKGKPFDQFKTAAAPTANGSSCTECGSTMHLGGPLWLGPLQNSDFAKRVIQDVQGQKAEYKTHSRMLGMLTIASQELADPFFFTANRIAKSMHLPSFGMSKIVSALLNGGYKISRAHAQPGAIKTDAPWSFIYDILREEAKTTPIRLDKISEGSPARVMIAKPMTHTIDFTPHPDANLERTGKETFYQINPLPNWGPAPRAKSIQVQGEKRKVVPTADAGAAEPKKAKLEDDRANEEDVLNG